MKHQYTVLIFGCPDDGDYSRDIQIELEGGLMLPSGSYINVQKEVNKHGN